MKNVALVFLLLLVATQGFSQTNRVMNLFPAGTILHSNIPYNNDTLPSPTGFANQFGIRITFEIQTSLERFDGQEQTV